MELYSADFRWNLEVVRLRLPWKTASSSEYPRDFHRLFTCVRREGSDNRSHWRRELYIQHAVCKSYGFGPLVRPSEEAT
jgi:hypothetical protein